MDTRLHLKEKKINTFCESVSILQKLTELKKYRIDYYTRSGEKKLAVELKQTFSTQDRAFYFWK